MFHKPHVMKLDTVAQIQAFFINVWLIYCSWKWWIMMWLFHLMDMSYPIHAFLLIINNKIPKHATMQQAVEYSTLDGNLAPSKQMQNLGTSQFFTFTCFLCTDFQQITVGPEPLRPSTWKHCRLIFGNTMMNVWAWCTCIDLCKMLHAYCLLLLTCQ